MKILITLASILSLTGCVGYYHHSVINNSEKMLNHVTVKCGERSFNHGYLAPNGTAGYSGSFKINKKKKISVSWELNETEYIKEIKLKKNPGSKEIVFMIDGENVTTEIISE